MDYYNVNDIIEMTGSTQNKAYEIIRELNKKFQKLFPNAVPLQGKVVKWFYDETQGKVKKEINNETK